MWKKTETPLPEPEPVEPPRTPTQQLKERALIGPSISIKGDLSGEEDLTIQGKIEGTIQLKKNNVTVGPSGSVKADIYGKVISIEGEVQGNLFGEEKIVVRKSGNVRGNVSAPRVTLEEGAKFKGSIDMDGVAGQAEAGADRKAGETRPLSPKETEKEPGATLGIKMDPSAPKP